jgi:hypothetical protein
MKPYVRFFFFFSSGPRAYDPDAPQPMGLLCYPNVLDVPTFAASPSPRPCYPRDPSQRKVELRGRESWPIILPKCTTSTEHLVFFYMPQVYDMGPTASAGFEPANLGTKGQHATPRPPKPFMCVYISTFSVQWLSFSFENRAVYEIMCGPGSSVGIVTAYRLDGPRIESR